MNRILSGEAWATCGLSLESSSLAFKDRSIFETDCRNRTLRVSYRHSLGNQKVEQVQQIRQVEERKRIN